MIATLIFQQARQKRRELIMLAGMIALYFFSYFQRVAVPGTVFNELQVDFNASAVAITTLGALFLYVYGSWQIFAGLLADRFGGLRMLLIGGLLMTVGALIFPLARSLPLLYTTRVLVAFGASFMYISLIKEIDTLFDRRHFAMLLSVTLFFGYSGGLFGTLPLERAVDWFGWRASFLGVGLLTAGVLLGNVWLMKRIRRPEPPHRRALRLFIKDIIQNRCGWYIIVPSAINFSIYFLFQASIGKKMLSDACGANSAQAAAIMFGMLLTTMVFTSLSGFLSRLIGNRRKPLIIGGTSLTLGALTFMLWVLAHPSDTAGLMAAGCVLLGISVSISPLLTSTMKEVNPEEAAATSVGLINCLSYLCVAATTNLAGMAMDAFREQAVVTTQAIIYPASAYRMILLGCLIAAAASWISSLFISETRGLCTYRQRLRLRLRF
ncbi:MAG: MFS transporter [Verrucomicrobia bacterium]|nr:MFS transporter [Verrucomicrobiota bacterium]MBU1734183.1 MFS transporter [Verrucomicrobiota bacterium]MBU1856519.1 MFS transporter [Verrucomicrobiota bacterium]